MLKIQTLKKQQYLIVFEKTDQVTYKILLRKFLFWHFFFFLDVKKNLSGIFKDIFLHLEHNLEVSDFSSYMNDVIAKIQLIIIHNT